MNGDSNPHPGLGSTTRDPGAPILEWSRNGPRPHLRLGGTGHPNAGIDHLDRKKCNLILIEVGFCRDFGCHAMLQEKTAKSAPLVTALKALWGKV